MPHREALYVPGGAAKVASVFPAKRLREVISKLQRSVDAFFPGNLVVELAGHGTHSSRLQRQRDEQRRTELTLRGLRVITFTYEDVRDRPDWVVLQLRTALSMTAA